jgi:hypothetical protein
LARFNIQIDIMIGSDRTKMFADAAQFYFHRRYQKP